MDDQGIELYSAYDGSFGSTYVDYFSGFVSRLPPGCNYLCFRDGQYSYVLYFGTDLAKDHDIVSGRVGYYRLNTYNGYTLTSGIEDVSEDITTGMYYGSFSGTASLLGGDYYVQVALLFAVCVMFLWAFLSSMYKLARHFRRG